MVRIVPGVPPGRPLVAVSMNQRAATLQVPRTSPEQVSGQRRDQVVIEDEDPQLEEEPQHAAVDAFQQVVVGLRHTQTHTHTHQIKHAVAARRS